MKKITDVPGKRRVAVDPWSESVTSYPQREEGIRFHAAKVVSDCGGKAAGELLGYPVTLVESVFSSQEVGLEGPEVRQLAWHANQLNCFPLRKEIRLFDGGKEIARTVETVVSVTEGQPDPSHFQIPAGYVERSPSEAMAEAARRYPKIMEIQCGPCQNTRLDEAYFHHQREHQ
jgi:hypothetical protein